MRIKTFIKTAKTIISSEGEVTEEIKLEFKSFSNEERLYIKGELYSYKEMLDKSDLEKRKNDTTVSRFSGVKSLTDEEFYSMLS